MAKGVATPINFRFYDVVRVDKFCGHGGTIFVLSWSFGCYPKKVKTWLFTSAL